MTSQELVAWQANFARTIMDGQRHVQVDGVHFSYDGCLFQYRYGNAKGLFFADSFFETHNAYRPAVRVSPSYSDECQFRPLSEPTLTDMAAAVKQSWAKFIADPPQ